MNGPNAYFARITLWQKLFRYNWNRAASILQNSLCAYNIGLYESPVTSTYSINADPPGGSAVVVNFEAFNKNYYNYI